MWRDVSLGVALITQVAHPQTGGVRQIKRIAAERLQLMRATTQKIRRQGRRSAEQIHQQPAVTTEITNQRDIAFGLVIASRNGWLHTLLAIIQPAQQVPDVLIEREIVMNAGDALHSLAIAQCQTSPVDMFEHADV